MLVSIVSLAIATIILTLASTYDSSLQFSPQGRVLQVEYAKRRADRGSPVIGVKCSDGVLLVSIRLRPRDRLHVRQQPKMFIVDEHVCVAVTGLIVDARVLVEMAKKLCLQYRTSFQTNMPIEQLGSELAAVMHAQTRRLSSRPLGVSLLVAGVDGLLGPQVYQINTEGTMDAWRAVSIGSNGQSLMARLAKLIEEGQLGENKSIDEVWRLLKRTLHSDHKRLFIPSDSQSESPTQVEVMQLPLRSFDASLFV